MSSEVTVTLTLSDAVKTRFNVQFANGDFVEGFVKLLEVDSTTAAHAMFMGFYDDWNAIPYTFVDSQADIINNNASLNVTPAVVDVRTFRDTALGTSA